MIDYAARRFREEVDAWPDGAYEADCYVDHDPLGHPDVHLHVKVTVDGDAAHASTSPAPTAATSSRRGRRSATPAGYTVAQIAAMMDPEIPKNEGFFDVDRARRAPGLRAQPRRRASRCRAGTHHPGAEVGEVIALAMQHVLPDKAVPQVYKTGIPTVIVGIDPRTGQSFTDHSAEVYAGWCNAAQGHGRLGLPGRRLRQPVEGHGRDQREPVPARAMEPRLPHRLRRRRASGAGCAAATTSRRCGSTPRSTPTWSGMKYPMPGIAGGQAGCAEPADDPLRDPTTRIVVAHTADWVPMAAGEQINYDYGGGGGWGDPLDRDPQAVLDDVLDEYVSVDGAERDYGVVLTGSLDDLTLAVDAAATDELRARRRTAVLAGDATVLGDTESAGCRTRLPRRRRRRGHVHRPHLRHARRARSCSTRRRPRSTTSRSA